MATIKEAQERARAEVRRGFSKDFTTPNPLLREGLRINDLLALTDTLIEQTIKEEKEKYDSFVSIAIEEAENVAILSDEHTANNIRRNVIRTLKSLQALNQDQ